MSIINAPKILDLTQLIDGPSSPSSIHHPVSVSPFPSEARDNSHLLGEDYPSTDKHIPGGDVFTSRNWVLRDGCYQILVIASPYHVD
jgi:ATP-dependent DNA helicase 2 subunit 1